MEADDVSARCLCEQDASTARKISLAALLLLAQETSASSSGSGTTGKLSLTGPLLPE